MKTIVKIKYYRVGIEDQGIPVVMGKCLLGSKAQSDPVDPDEGSSSFTGSINWVQYNVLQNKI